jgi:WD40 repeat protein/serine/threonine protein kinase
MEDDSLERNPVEVLADEFLARDRRGEQPSIGEYVERYPELADEIHELFPLVLDIEQVRAGAVPPPTATLAPVGLSSTKLGDYRIIREIGRGGMGVVFEAEQESLGRRVALKVLARTALTAQQVRRFEREARSAAGLHHTNIVPIFGVGCEGDRHYYVMQYIPGQPLDEVLREVDRMRRGASPPSPRVSALRTEGSDHRPDVALVACSLLNNANARTRSDASSEVDCVLVPATTEIDSAGRAGGPDGSRPADEACSSISSSDAVASSSELTGFGNRYARAVARIGVQVADAIDYAAQQGIIHRDVKPSNILLDLRGTAWVTDFGLAKVAGQEDLTHSGDLVGTLRYMAPERFRGEADGRSDVYSLGLTLYELLAVRPAYDEVDRARLIRLMTEEDPPGLMKVDPSIPRDLATIVQKAIEREPADRYGSADALASDLCRFLEDRPIAARRPGPLDRVAKWSRRNRALVRVAGAMLLVLVLGLAVATTLVWRANRALIRALQDEHYASYLQRIALAERESASNNVRRAEELLAECPQTMRGWEWHYLKRLRGGSIPPLSHSAGVYALAVSPAGDRLAASDIRGGITIWDTHTYEPITRIAAHEGVAWGVAFSPDGKQLASCGDHRDCRVKIWDTISGQLLRELKGHFDSVFSVVFSSDGRRLASYAGRGSTAPAEVRVWDAGSGALLRKWSLPEAWQMAGSPNGRQLACVWGDTEVGLWDISTGRQIRRLAGGGQALWAVAFSPDGRWLAAGSGMHAHRNGEVTIWDARTGLKRRTLYGHIEMVNALAFSADSQRLASAGLDQTVKIWDVGTGREVVSLRGHRNTVLALAFGPDGRLYSGSDDRTVLVWDGRPVSEAEVGQEFLTLRGHGDTVTSVAFSPDERLLVSADCTGIIKLWPLWSGRQPRTIRGSDRELYGVALSPDGQTFAAVGDGSMITFWATSSGKIIRDFSSNDECAIMCAAVSADGRYLAGGGWGWGFAIRIWDLHSGRQVGELTGHGVAPYTVAFRPDDSRYLVSGGEDGTVRLWDVPAGKEVRQLGPTQQGRVKGVAFCASGALLACGGWDRIVHLWDTTDPDPAGWRPLASPTDPTGSIECVAISRDGRHVAWGGTDSTVKVYDRIREEIHTLRGHLSWVRTIAFSRDGDHIASGSQDGTVKIWPLPSGDRHTFNAVE